MCGVALGAFAAVSLCSLGNDAAADDPGPVAWSGVYIGAGLGVASGDTGWVYGSGFSPEINPLDLDSVLVGGFHLGVQRQWGGVVAGIETSVLFGDLNGVSPCTPPASPFSCSVDVNRIWMIGPRLGIATNNLHFYGTGGYALGTLESKSVITATGVLVDSGHGRHGGWYLGGGVEWSLGRAVVLGVEYRRIEFDDDTHPSSTGVAAAGREIDATIDTIQARLTFKIGDILRGAPSR